MQARHSVQETSQFHSIQPQSSSYPKSGGSSQHPGQPSGTYSYQELDSRPAFDYNQSTSQVPAFNVAHQRANVNMISDQDLLEEFLGPHNQAGNQGGNQD
ncbi:hypothetical protein P8452_21626 [Trifolium repens]|nr:hypothetical protein P8452_21626 [Trifolium repens]